MKFRIIASIIITVILIIAFVLFGVRKNTEEFPEGATPEEVQ